MTNEETTWLEVNRVYNENRLYLIEQLSALDAWYGEQNIARSYNASEQRDFVV